MATKNDIRPLVAFCLLFLPTVAGAAETWIGSVKTAQGNATVRRGNDSLPMREGMHLQEHDVIQTGADGRVGAILKDNTRFSMGPNSELSIDQFAFNPGQTEYGLVLRMLRGVVAVISGKIARFSPDSFRMETPVGIVGMRGTEFVVALEQQP